MVSVCCAISDSISLTTGEFRKCPVENFESLQSTQKLIHRSLEVAVGTTIGVHKKLGVTA